MLKRWKMILFATMAVFAVFLSGCETEHYNRAIGYESGARLVVTVEEPGEEPETVQLLQTDVRLQAGQDYVLTFSARAAAAREMRVRIGTVEGDVEAVTDIVSDVVTLTPTTTNYFVHLSAEETLEDAVLIFELGKVGAEAVATDVAFESVRIRPYDGDVADLHLAEDLETLEFGDNVVSNWDFGEGTDAWTLHVSEDASATYTVVDGERLGFGWMQWIVGAVADLIHATSRLAGGYYIVGLFVITLLIRIVGWPIYSKTTALSTNMTLAQPEIDKIKQKYMGRKDPQSQQMLQQETMRVYKEYGVNPLGCLLPVFQMPIFIAMYQTVRRLPLTHRYQDLNFGFTPWTDFTDVPAEPFFANIGNNIVFILMAVIVGATMFLFQMYAQKKPDILQNKKFQTEQQKNTEKTMKYMMYFMTLMLVFIAYTNLGIAFYWIIGNLFQFLQTYINRKRTIARVMERKQKASALKTTGKL